MASTISDQRMTFTAELLRRFVLRWRVPEVSRVVAHGDAHDFNGFADHAAERFST